MNTSATDTFRADNEVRVLAALLGEASPAEQAAVRQLLDADPALRAWRDEAQAAAPLLREALRAATAPEGADIPRMDAARRAALLEQLRAVILSGKTPPPAPAVVPWKTLLRQNWGALAACAVCALAAAGIAYRLYNPPMPDREDGKFAGKWWQTQDSVTSTASAGGGYAPAREFAAVPAPRSPAASPEGGLWTFYNSQAEVPASVLARKSLKGNSSRSQTSQPFDNNNVDYNNGSKQESSSPAKPTSHAPKSEKSEEMVPLQIAVPPVEIVGTPRALRLDKESLAVKPASAPPSASTQQNFSQFRAGGQSAPFPASVFAPAAAVAPTEAVPANQEGIVLAAVSLSDAQEAEAPATPSMPPDSGAVSDGKIPPLSEILGKEAADAYSASGHPKSERNLMITGGRIGMTPSVSTKSGSIVNGSNLNGGNITIGSSYSGNATSIGSIGGNTLTNELFKSGSGTLTLNETNGYTGGSIASDISGTTRGSTFSGNITSDGLEYNGFSTTSDLGNFDGAADIGRVSGAGGGIGRGVGGGKNRVPLADENGGGAGGGEGSGIWVSGSVSVDRVFSGAPVHRSSRSDANGRISEKKQEGFAENRALPSSTSLPLSSEWDTPAIFNREQLDKDVPSVAQGSTQPTAFLARSTRSSKPAKAAVRTLENAFSTFSLNISDASFRLAAEALRQSRWPDAASLRVEEFVNALAYADPPPAAGEDVSLSQGQARDPFSHNQNFLRLSIQTASAGRDARQPLNLTILLDTSGSMERADRQETTAAALESLAAFLRPGDTVSLVGFAREPRLLLSETGAAAQKALRQLIGSVPSEGGTNLELALRAAYRQNRQTQKSGALNRVVLLTDGAANLGDADPAALAKIAAENKNAGVSLDCYGVGFDEYNDTLLETLSRAAYGRYGFLNTAEDAREDFAKKLAGALQVAAQNVKVQVEFNPARVPSHLLLGYDKHRLAREDFRDNSVSAARMGAAERGVALYLVETDPDGSGDIGVLRVRYQEPRTGEYRERAWTIPYEPDAPALDKAPADTRLAVAAALFAEKLEGSPRANAATFKALADIARRANAARRDAAVPEPNRTLQTMLETALRME
jgi:Mg-chelatase subunit ChlD